MRILAVAAAMFLLLALPARAGEVWVAARTLLPGERLAAEDATTRTVAHVMPGALPASRSVTGLEPRHRIPTGQILTDRDLGPPLLVRANDVVRVTWHADNISLELSGRALESAAAGEPVRVLNPMTARTINGIVQPDGTVLAGSAP